MNKSELIDVIAEQANISKADGSNAITAIISAIGDALANGDTVTLAGFGTFSIASRAARTGRNPQTGAAIAIEAHDTPRFKAAKQFAEALSE